MDNNKDPGGNLALWLPGGAVIISIVVSTFALTREPFFEARPTGAQFQVDQPIEARLWQDPFDALERHRKKSKDGKDQNSKSSDSAFACTTALSNKPTEKSSTEQSAIMAKVSLAAPIKTTSEPSIKIELPSAIIVKNPSEPIKIEVSSEKTVEKIPQRHSIMVALVASGPYADEVEARRRIRYAILAGLKNARMVPEDEQHIHCLALADDLSRDPQKNKKRVEIPYENFVENSLNHPINLDDNEPTPNRITLLWLKEEYLGSKPLKTLEALRGALSKKLDKLYANQENSDGYTQGTFLKVIGPSTSTILRDMYRETYQKNATDMKIGSNIEIYSPLATAEEKMLIRGFDLPLSNKSSAQQKQQEQPTGKSSMRLLRTVSDDGTLAHLLLEELKRRRVDPVYGLNCSKDAPAKVGSPCDASDWRSNRIALVSEWDSFYSRAITKTFKENIVKRAGSSEGSFAEVNVNDWVLQFSYLRGLDGLLPEESASERKSSNNKNSQHDSNLLDIGSLENSDGNSQLDYLRRLADHIAAQDTAYRQSGESGIGAIGVLGTDAYDKLLVLQALKSRMPNKVFFSTDLDARMLQRGHAKTVRNLVLAASYGLTLTRKLQQDVPPFRDSLQSGVFVAVLAALSPQRFEDKLAKFDYADSGLLSPGIYEVGIHGFIPLKSSHADVCQASARVRWRATGNKDEGATPDIMLLPCLQDQPSPPYPELSKAARDTLNKYLSIWWAKPLSLILLLLAIFLGWWWTEKEKEENPLINVGTLPSWVHNLPLALYVVAALSALFAVWLWRVEFMWATFLLILFGIICSQLNRRLQQHTPHTGGTLASTNSKLLDSPAYYITIPMVVFILVVLWVYQQRRSLTEDGLGEPMFLFEGVSAWPTLGLRLIAVLISISAIAWGWRNLRINREEIENSYHLWNCQPSLWQSFPSFIYNGKRKPFRKWLIEFGDCLSQILFPLSSSSIARIEVKAKDSSIQSDSNGKRPLIYLESFWEAHCTCGAFGARLLRAILATWIFVVVTSALYVVWPIEGIPMRGDSYIWRLQILKLSWMVPTLAFYLLVFWVADANRLLVRFIHQLNDHHAIWPPKLQREHKEIFNIHEHPCIDDWVDMMLIARRTAAVNRLIYAPTVVLLILIVSRSSVFDNWPTPPSMVISFVLIALVLFISALSLRRAAEKARGMALQRIDQYLLETPDSEKGYDKFRLIRERIAALNTGAFSRYTEEPLVRALLLSLAGIGGSAIVEVLNYSKF
ncbi:hypothetical protein HA520_07170 [Azotobacter chroococcum]|uniref:Uncharacterized protein n=1 Tax=Azotobacter chroococcum TaxID=353 RepID=A0AA44C816_9GAMM|nr:hypothetical protein [Azotobacter chroococcum]NHN77073.1 hypothetical protein [Azotobacter chroococcum]